MQELVYKEDISHIINLFNSLTFPKKEWVSFNSHYSSVISGAFSSRNYNDPNTDAQQPVRLLSSALAECCLPLWECKVAALEHLKSFGCSCTPCLPSAMQHPHLVTNPQKRSLLLWFDLLLQPRRSPPTGLPPPRPEMPWHVCGTWATSPRPLARRATTLLLTDVPRDQPAASQWHSRGSLLPQTWHWHPSAPWCTRSAASFKYVLTGGEIAEYYTHRYNRWIRGTNYQQLKPVSSSTVKYVSKSTQKLPPVWPATTETKLLSYGTSSASR